MGAGQSYRENIASLKNEFKKLAEEIAKEVLKALRKKWRRAGYLLVPVYALRRKMLTTIRPRHRIGACPPFAEPA